MLKALKLPGWLTLMVAGLITWGWVWKCRTYVFYIGKKTED